MKPVKIVKDYFKSELCGAATVLLLIAFTITMMVLFGAKDVMARELEFGSKLVSEFNYKPWSVFPQVEGHSLEQVETLRQAYDISGGDRDFLYMLKGENGNITIDKKSDVPGESSYGLCQIHAGYHPEIVWDPRFFIDKEWQLGQCYRLWKGGTPFYGFGNKW